MTEHPRPIAVLWLAGAAYVVVGVGFAVLANTASSSGERVAWRLGAWVVSGVVFAAQIWYEHFSLPSRPRTTALRAAAASGVGGFGLAAYATIHSFVTAPGAAHGRFGLALVLWPMITAVPAWIAALAIAMVLPRPR